jgi:universal stress protein F
VKLARCLAGEAGKVRLLHVVPPLPAYVVAETPPSILEGHQKEAEERLAALGREGGRVDTTLTAMGHPATAILDEAERIGADAIVVGSHRPGLSTLSDRVDRGAGGAPRALLGARRP